MFCFECKKKKKKGVLGLKLDVGEFIMERLLSLSYIIKQEKEFEVKKKKKKKTQFKDYSSFGQKKKKYSYVIRSRDTYKIVFTFNIIHNKWYKLSTLYISSTFTSSLMSFIQINLLED